jgi:uroporphyrinogen decarboxylase
MNDQDQLKPDFQNRLLKAIYCQGEPDRVPLVEAGIDPSVKSQFLGHPIDSLTDEITFWSSAGYDFVPLESGLRTIIDAAIHHEKSGRFESDLPDPPEVAAAKEYAIQKLRPLHLATEDSDGTLRTWAPQGHGFITSMDDLESFPWPSPEDLDLSTLQDVPSMLPEGMGTLCFSGAIFSSVMLMMGFESCFMAIASEDELFRSLFKRVGEFQVDVVRRVLDLNSVGGIWINDDMGHKTGTLVHPKIYKKYLFPYYREIRELTSSKDIPLLLHSDGRITEILPDLVEIGFNAIHPIDPSGMDLEEARQIVGNDVCLIGNLSLSYPLGTGSPEQVSQETEKMVRMMAPGGGYCLSSANSIPDYVPYENWRAMRDTALRVGVYPVLPLS